MVESSPCFRAEPKKGVAQAIIRSVYDFKIDPFPEVSDNEKNLLKGMLDTDLNMLLTLQEVLGNVQLRQLFVFLYLCLLINTNK